MEPRRRKTSSRNRAEHDKRLEQTRHGHRADDAKQREINKRAKREDEGSKEDDGQTERQEARHETSTRLRNPGKPTAARQTKFETQNHKGQRR